MERWKEFPMRKLVMIVMLGTGVWCHVTEVVSAQNRTKTLEKIVVGATKALPGSGWKETSHASRSREPLTVAAISQRRCLPTET